MKKDTTRKDFSTDDEVKETTLKWLREIGCKFSENEIRKLVPRCDKCLQILGDYVEEVVAGCKFTLVMK
ncbi:hypothetical protein WH47_03105 [Habropoda laboriosa]|uniref:Uncharacterized protein n=1 Tax=Habropoda laboriosa TaxID=597456 RepID=A0A0L7QWK1_9HYME|nr:hypothetical protein WH47_03105 [Habropoda laboriosa]